MRPWIDIALLFVAAYIAGAIPFGVIVGRFHGIDVTTQGSRNIGATNVGRLLGKKWGLLVFALDVCKGLIPAMLAGYALHSHVGDGTLTMMTANIFWLVIALMTVIGHSFSVFIGGKGGKGVATSLGVALGIYPALTIPALGAFVVWVILVAIFRYVSLGSIIGSFAFVGFAIAWAKFKETDQFTSQLPFIGFTVLAAVFIVIRHRANIGRLLAGTENKVFQGKKKEEGREEAEGRRQKAEE